jgi:hypothetical protein
VILFGGREEYFEALEALGQPTPLRKRPRLPSRLLGVFKAFLILHQQRSAGFNANPISITDINAYFDILGFLSLED